MESNHIMTFYRNAYAFLFALLWLLGMAPVATAAEVTIIDQVAAIVNDDVITLSEIDAEATPLLRRIKSQGMAQSEEQAAMQKARQDILDRLIEKTLQVQKANEIGMDIDDAEVEHAIARIMEKNNRNKEEFQQDLKKIGTDEVRYRQSIKSQMLESRLVSMEVRSKVVITDKMVKEYYDSQYVQQSAPEGYTILQMGFVWGQAGRSASRDEARQRAEEARQQVLTGADFQELAKDLSDMPSARDGGAIGTLAKEEMAPYMREVILPLAPGQVSELVETEAGFQFFKLMSAKEGNVVVKAPFDTVQEEIRNILYSQESEQLYKVWMDQLREKAYIKKMM